MTVPAITMTEPVGAPGGPLLVLGPSLGTSTILWDDTLPMLREHFRVQRFDLPGHGRSPVTTEPFTVAELAQAVLGAATDQRFLYAGVSLGGAIGLELLLAAPERLLAASIICSGAELGDAEFWAQRAATVRSQGTASLVVPSAGRWFAPGSIERRPELTGRLLHSLRDAYDEGYALCSEALGAYDVRSRLGEITPPVLALWGEHDPVVNEAEAREIADGVQHGTAERIADASHLAPAEQPEAVAQALIDFFRSANG
jgi:3-oxoadipate enol-lactonase